MHFYSFSYSEQSFSEQARGPGVGVLEAEQNLTWTHTEPETECLKAHGQVSGAQIRMGGGGRGAMRTGKGLPVPTSHCTGLSGAPWGQRPV